MEFFRRILTKTITPELLIQPGFQETVLAFSLEEIPAGLTVNFVIHAKHLDETLSLELGCGIGQSPRRILNHTEKTSSARIDRPSPDLLFLSPDPGQIRQPGCRLVATLQTKAVRSDPIDLGAVIRLARIFQFSLSGEKLPGNLYLGTLTGEDLQTIEKTGWDLGDSYSVQSIPQPMMEFPGRQRLKIALSWPPPSPHAPPYIWLRGEQAGRSTKIKY